LGLLVRRRPANRCGVNGGCGPAMRQGDLATGLPLLRKALYLAGEARYLPRFLLPIGEFPACLGEAGEVSQGLATVDEALARCEARDEGWYVAELWRIKGELLLLPGARRSTIAAAQAFERAFVVARSQGAIVLGAANGGQRGTIEHE
jgi:predicted ATPase